MKLVSKADFARMAKVTKGALTKACSKQLAPALVGTRVDVDHPAAQAYAGKVRPPPARERPAPRRTYSDAEIDQIVVRVCQRVIELCKSGRPERAGE